VEKRGNKKIKSIGSHARASLTQALKQIHVVYDREEKIVANLIANLLYMLALR
jgi:hypothetical protein